MEKCQDKQEKKDLTLAFIEIKIGFHCLYFFNSHFCIFRLQPLVQKNANFSILTFILNAIS